MVLDNKLLVQHALRQTLAVDSLCLQFRLPPSSFPPTNARLSSMDIFDNETRIFRSCASVAGGTPVVDALVVTSVWAVHILRGLCQDRSYRSLVSLGVAGVGRSAPVSFNPSDTLRYNTIITGLLFLIQQIRTTIFNQEYKIKRCRQRKDCLKLYL